MLFTVLALHLVAVSRAQLQNPAVSVLQLPPVFRLSALPISSIRKGRHLLSTGHLATCPWDSLAFISVQHRNRAVL